MQNVKPFALLIILSVFGFYLATGTGFFATQICPSNSAV